MFVSQQLKKQETVHQKTPPHNKEKDMTSSPSSSSNIVMQPSNFQFIQFSQNTAKPLPTYDNSKKSVTSSVIQRVPGLQVGTLVHFKLNEGNAKAIGKIVKIIDENTYSIIQLNSNEEALGSEQEVTQENVTPIISSDAQITEHMRGIFENGLLSKNEREKRETQSASQTSDSSASQSDSINDVICVNFFNYAHYQNEIESLVDRLLTDQATGAFPIAMENGNDPSLGFLSEEITKSIHKIEEKKHTAVEIILTKTGEEKAAAEQEYLTLMQEKIIIDASNNKLITHILNARLKNTMLIIANADFTSEKKPQRKVLREEHVKQQIPSASFYYVLIPEQTNPHFTTEKEIPILRVPMKTTLIELSTNNAFVQRGNVSTYLKFKLDVPDYKSYLPAILGADNAPENFYTHLVRL